MHFNEPKLPKRLKETQEWFASIITQPVDHESRIAAKTPRGRAIVDEAATFILPNPFLKSHERIEIYNQQYWWRLLNTLQDAFPLLLGLFGFTDFNQSIAIPYLKKFPPNYWSLNVLGDRLTKWVKERYHKEDRELVLNSAEVDFAFNFAFFAKQLPSLSASDLQNAGIMQEKLYLQPHVYLFKLPYDLFSFRKILIKENADHWIENEFPELKNERDYTFMVFRKPNNNVSWRELSSTEHALLRKFSLGDSVEKICRWIEEQNANLQEEAESKLSEWFQSWTQESLLTKQPHKKS